MPTPGALPFEAIDPQLQELMRPVYDRLGYFGEFFGQAAHSPSDVLIGFMKFSAGLKNALPDDLNETLALAVCHHMEFPYERIQHERLSEKLGFDRDWIAALTGRGDDKPLTEMQKLVRDCGLALAEGDIASTQKLTAQIAEKGSDGMAVSVLFQATRYMQVCLIGRALDIKLPQNIRSVLD